jgi:hypothetical protein
MHVHVQRPTMNLAAGAFIAAAGAALYESNLTVCRRVAHWLKTPFVPKRNTEIGTAT